MELICSVDSNLESAQAKSSNRNSIIICFYIEFTFVLFFIAIRPNQHVFFLFLLLSNRLIFISTPTTEPTTRLKLSPHFYLYASVICCAISVSIICRIYRHKKMKKKKKKREMTKLVVSFSAYTVILKLMPFITSCYTFRCALLSLIVVVLSSFFFTVCHIVVCFCILIFAHHCSDILSLLLWDYFQVQKMWIKQQQQQKASQVELYA